jgi:hypothetical protein
MADHPVENSGGGAKRKLVIPPLQLPVATNNANVEHAVPPELHVPPRNPAGGEGLRRSGLAGKGHL